ncbi:energy-coupling factor ABC transporter permease [Candidatus Bathyarchaeota archaeon]|nr:energy-coupling factor ABC transporter permease [Candidatus Bathyarchaeota archaeon]
MAHIHLPDGALSLGWVLTWWAVYLATTSGVAYTLRRRGALDPLKISITAMATAASFAVFQVNIPVLGGIHLSLTPLVGILLGPAFGAVSVFIVNIFSAAVGHGGWGLIGANSVVNTVEASLGYFSFHILRKRLSVFSAGALATIAALTVGSLVMVCIIAASGIQGSALTMMETASNLMLLTTVNIFVAVIEGIITGFTLTYLSKLRPDFFSGSGS